MANSGTVAGDGGGVADAALRSSLALLRSLGDRPGYAFSDGEILANLRAVHALIAAAEAVRLRFVEELRTRPGAVPGSGPGSGTGAGAKRFLTEALHVTPGQAQKDLDAAQAAYSATPTVPATAQALTDGAVSRAHLDVTVRALSHLPKRLKTKTITGGGTDPDGHPVDVTGLEYLDAVVTEQARLSAPTDVERLCRRIRHLLDPDRTDRFDADADERRSCTMTSDFAGMAVLTATLDPASGLEVRGAIARRATPRPAGTAAHENGDQVEIRDTRSPRQRQADALVELVMAGSRALDDPRPARPEARQPAVDRTGPGQGAAAPTQSGGAGWQAAGGVDVTIVATLPQILAAHLPQNRQHAAEIAAAGLARTTLAGPGGTYPGATLDPRTLPA